MGRIFGCGPCFARQGRQAAPGRAAGVCVLSSPLSHIPGQLSNVPANRRPAHTMEPRIVGLPAMRPQWHVAAQVRSKERLPAPGRFGLPLGIVTPPASSTFIGFGFRGISRPART